jgi:hypothetical protein
VSDYNSLSLVISFVVSLTELGRRRKIRCIQSFENAQTCRRCEEQGLECIAQTHTSGSTRTQRLSSKQRVAQLESKVLSLTETVRQMQEKLNVQATQNDDMSLEQLFEDNGPGISVSEQSIAEQPFHLRLLFQNDWLSVEGPSESRARQGHGITSTAHLLAVARKSLQVLIPSKDEIFKNSDSASEWLSMLQSFFPLPCGTTRGEEVVAGYEEMHSPNVDPIKLASWMITVAMITEQLPQENVRMGIRLNNRQRHSSLSKAISATVEIKVLAYDTMTGSIEGLSLLMQFIRL